MRAKSLIAFFLLVAAGSVSAMPIPAPPQLAAKSYLLMEARSGQVIAAVNADERREPASLTKLMSAYVVFHALKDGVVHLDDLAPVSERAWRMGGSRMFAKLGTKVSVDDLLQGMIVQSGNDATVALAERVGGTEDSFVQLMNEYADRLGMHDSHFVDASGLTDDRQHYMTARDLATLSRAIVTEFPQYLHYFSEKEFTWNKIKQANRNDLLFSDPSVDGLKTGDTDRAGYCLIASANRGPMRLISVVMGAKTEKARAQFAETLLNYGSNFFDTRKLYDAGTPVSSVTVWKGAQGSVPVGATEDLYVTLPKGAYGELQAAVQGSAGLIAPVAEHAPVGTLQLTVEGKLLAEKPVYTLQAVPEGNIFRRMIDSIRLWFRKK
ncbi:MAG: D-alanyl-D-alanine carboxypeptidase family protein [Bacillota bacterium]